MNKPEAFKGRTVEILDPDWLLTAIPPIFKSVLVKGCKVNCCNPP